jgi:hypothetical protein
MVQISFIKKISVFINKTSQHHVYMVQHLSGGVYDLPDAFDLYIERP